MKGEKLTDFCFQLIGTIITYELVIVDQILEAPEIVQKTCHVVYNMSELKN